MRRQADKGCDGAAIESAEFRQPRNQRAGDGGSYSRRRLQALSETAHPIICAQMAGDLGFDPEQAAGYRQDGAVDVAAQKGVVVQVRSAWWD